MNDDHDSTFSVGVERLLALAADDDVLKDELLRGPIAAASAAGVDLSPGEQRLLRAVDGATLERMVTSFAERVPASRRSFLAQASGATLAGALLAGCPVTGSRPGPAPTGSRPDAPPNTAPTGSRPDPPPGTEAPTSQPAHPTHHSGGRGGIRPDRP